MSYDFEVASMGRFGGMDAPFRDDGDASSSFTHGVESLDAAAAASLVAAASSSSSSSSSQQPVPELSLAPDDPRQPRPLLTEKFMLRFFKVNRAFFPLFWRAEMKKKKARRRKVDVPTSTPNLHSMMTNRGRGHRVAAPPARSGPFHPLFPISAPRIRCIQELCANKTRTQRAGVEKSRAGAFCFFSFFSRSRHPSSSRSLFRPISQTQISPTPRLLSKNAPKKTPDCPLPSTRGARLGRVPLRPRGRKGAQARPHVRRWQLERRDDAGGRASIHRHRVPEHEVGKCFFIFCGRDRVVTS